MYNPYANADFSSQIKSISHYHCEPSFPVAYYDVLANENILHVGISNYYPSKPVYPLSDYFVPFEGAIECPNAEHHNFGNPFGVSGRLHMNGLGSLCISGSPAGETPVGFNGLPWDEAIDIILDDLLYADAGGVTINHPKWTGISAKDCCQILDHDARVLGLEFYNQSSEEDDTIPRGWSIDIWDAVLRTGRKCYGFSVPDHSFNPIKATNVLLVNPSVYNCLKAYRDGAFYGKIGLTDFAFTSITYQNGVLSCTVNKQADFKIVTDSEVFTGTGTSISRNIDSDDYVYARIEAKTADDEIYSNPIFLDKPGTEITDERKSFGVNFAHYFHP